MISKKAVSGIAKNTAGFTLLEMAIVMIVSGLIMASLVGVYSVYVQNQRLDAVAAKQSIITSTVFSYFSNIENGRYPCPARPDLPIEDMMSGVEDCTILDPGYAVGTCLNGICKAGGRDTFADADGDPDIVLIGAVPYKTLTTGINNSLQCFSYTDGSPLPCTDPDAYNPAESKLKDVNMRDTVNPWLYQMSYAVSASQTSKATFNSSYGAIDVTTEAGISLVDPPGSAHFVIIDSGPNAMGAYTAAGVLVTPCTAGTMDAENCDGDATFIAGLRNMGDGAEYFDDTVVYQAYVASQLWMFSGPNIYNVNPGNVGIGTSNPLQKLHVVGDVRASKLATDVLCDITGDNCWDPDILGSSEGTVCSDEPSAPGKFRIMTGIKNGAVTCSGEIDVPTLPLGQSCPTGQYMVGLTISGGLICEVP